MWTDQYYTMINRALNGVNTTDMRFRVAPVTLTVRSGTTDTYSYMVFPLIPTGLDGFPAAAGNTSFDKKNYIMFGNGSTAPSASDTDLESIILSGLTISSTAEEESTGKRFTVTVKNTSGNTLTLSEVGLYCPISKTATTFSNPNNYVLLMRDTFSPISLSAGDTVTFNLIVCGQITRAS